MNLPSLNRMRARAAAAALLASTLAGAPALAADVDVSVTLGHPSFYGRIDIGGPPPPVLYRQPVIIERVVAPEPPIYLRVPPGHAKNWRKHCGRYDACGRRVYFVRDDWYRNVYVPAHRPHREGPPRMVDRRGDRHDNDRQDRGRGHDKKGQGKGKHD